VATGDKPVKSVQWTDLSHERRKLGRAAANTPPHAAQTIAQTNFFEHTP